MKAAVLVLHYGRNSEDERVSDQCFRSLVGQGAKLVLIDNGSPVPWRPTGVLRLRLEKNLPLIEAFNVGLQYLIEKSDCEAFFCLNNDTVASRGMIGRLCEVLGDPRVGIVAPGSSDQGTGVLHVPYASPEWMDVEAKHVDNHAWGFRRDVVERIGLPDAKGHTHRANWASNRDYCYRARMAGYKVIAVRSAYIMHSGGKYNPEADLAGQEWLRQKWGEKAGEVWD